MDDQTSEPVEAAFDNVALRARGERCLVFSVAPPFQSVYWQQVETAARELGFSRMTAGSLRRPETLATFLQVVGAQIHPAFRPARIGFPLTPEGVRGREAYRGRCRSVILPGPCSRRVALAALDLVAGQVAPGGRVEVTWRWPGALSDWPRARELLGEICACLRQSHGLEASLLAFTDLATPEPGLWEFAYDRPMVRFGWVATGLEDCATMEAFEAWRDGSGAFGNLQRLADSGLWPHVVLPVAAANVGILPELVLALVEATRGGTVELAPVGAWAGGANRGGIGPGHGPNDGNARAALSCPPRGDREFPGRQSLGEKGACPTVEAYTEAVLAIYRNQNVPLKLVSPLSWVSARVDSPAPLLGSPASAGAEVVVLPNGDLHAGESVAGLERWRLGNATDNPKEIRWERLDFMAEAFSNATKPEKCKRCDWRYRCGGVDASVRLMEEAARRGQDGEDAGRMPAPLFELYCAPRKRLFEEMIWGSAEAAAAARNGGPRERLELRPDGIDFTPATNA
jgi:radical SAM protein with 4Fe4S-binding SPASM domain